MILLDADVLLDVALDRTPHADASAELVDRLERGRHRGFVAWHTLSNLYYLLRPQTGTSDARDFLDALTAFLVVAPVDTAAYRFATSLPMRDLEDAMQVGAARACGALYIATRNLGDFADSPVPARAPEALLDLLN